MVDHVNYLVWRVIICSSNHLWGRGNCKSVAWQVQMGPCYPIPQQMVHVEDIGARKAAYMEILNQLSENLRSALKSMGINKFYSHQALAQDQLRALLDMTKGIDASLNIGIYDGDTSQKERTWLRDNARLAKQLAELLDEDPALMDRRQQCARRLALYKSARDEIDSVSWSR
ncbi:hypothetical protein RGQ29_005703 [Quercus rubra]|uniref:Dynamin GTPase effector domain-containing protein n=1 Tax=Quercus rubra TaxID=3512 RepID=A0AAN7E590_QUERU|nr:hypothetical protein RGQ29_005703 [Quercus rubra]